MEEEFEDIEESFWNPEKENDSVVGVLKIIKEEVGKNKSRVYVLENNGRITNVWGSKVLDERMSIIALGEKIKIIYLGEKTGEKRKYHDYKVQRAVPKKE